jgi:hypothetical protein
MTQNSGSQRVVSVYGEPAKGQEPAEKKRLTRIRRLIGAALLALLSVVALILLAPGALKMFLPQPRPLSVVHRPSSVASAPADTELLPEVPVAWEKLDLGAMPADVALDLKSGKYYYDKRFPGNFGLAIGSWKQAFDRLAAPDRDGVQRLIAAANLELAGQFRADSGDAIVLIKQGKRGLAIILLEKMRADFPDITSPQYAWASTTLSRLRR